VVAANGEKFPRRAKFDYVQLAEIEVRSTQANGVTVADLRSCCETDWVLSGK